MNCSCPKIEVGPLISIVQHTVECPKNTNKKAFGVKLYPLQSGPAEYQPREIPVLSDIEGEVATNPIWQDNANRHIPEEGANFQAITGPGVWLREQEFLLRRLGSKNPTAVRDFDKCEICHVRPVRRKSDGRYPTLHACQECADARLKQQRKEGGLRHRRKLRGIRICARCKIGTVELRKKICAQCLQKSRLEHREVEREYFRGYHQKQMAEKRRLREIAETSLDETRPGEIIL